MLREANREDIDHVACLTKMLWSKKMSSAH